MDWELIPRVAEGADPVLGLKVAARVRVEDGSAALAEHRLVRQHLRSVPLVSVE